MNIEEKIDKIIQDMSDLANKRVGGAWTSGFCVVGQDMSQGIFLVKNIISEYDFANGLAPKQQQEELYKRIKKSAKSYNGNDSEGYVVGTILQLAQYIDEIS